MLVQVATCGVVCLLVGKGNRDALIVSVLVTSSAAQSQFFSQEQGKNIEKLSNPDHQLRGLREQSIVICTEVVVEGSEGGQLVELRVQLSAVLLGKPVRVVDVDGVGHCISVEAETTRGRDETFNEVIRSCREEMF